MRVGILSPSVSPTLGGGHTFEHEIFEQVMALAPGSNHEFVIFDRSKNSAITAEIRKCKRMSLPQRGRGYPWENKSVARILKREKIEFFLNTSFETITLDIPFLVIVLDLQHRLQPFFPEVSLGGVWKSRENFFSQELRRAAFVIAGTEAGRKELQMFYGIADERIRVLPHPTPRFALEENVSQDVDLSNHKLPRDYIFYPAQFWSHKNHVGLLRAAHHLKETENLRLPIVFTGSDQGNESYVREVVQSLQLEDQVYFLGHVSRETLRALYQNAFVLCYASFFGPENFPPLEAFALGCPVIAADVPGASEQLGDAAIRVNPANELEIAHALKSLWHDKAKRQSLILRGRERARRFTGADFAKGLFELLDEFQAVRRCWSANPPVA
jgi:glycosyltransferase involved in cell wall biosynthesis